MKPRMCKRPSMAVLMMSVVAEVCLNTLFIHVAIGQTPPTPSESDDR